MCDNTISLLTGIKKKYGNDIYDEIRSHLKKKHDYDIIIKYLIQIDNTLTRMNNTLTKY